MEYSTIKQIYINELNFQEIMTISIVKVKYEDAVIRNLV